MILSPLSLENGRGGEISSMELAAGLNKYHKITLIDTNIIFNKNLLSKGSILKKLDGVERNDRIKFATLKIFNKHFTFPYFRDIFRLYKKIKNCNIIYTSNFTIKTNLLLVLFNLLHRNGRFLIGHRKPLYSEKLFSIYNLKNRASFLLFSIFKKRFYHHTISYHAKKFLENFISSNKITHIVHGIDLYDYADDSMVKKQDQKLNFIYVGYLDDIHKGVNVLLDGIEKIIEKDHKLDLFFEFCGEGPLENRLKKLQEKFPGYIRYNGYVNNEIISDYYKRNDVFLFTSRREPFGRVLIEALASNLLIICTKTFGSIEVLKNKKFAFFLNDLDADLIKDKIIGILELWKEKIKDLRELQKLAKIYAFQNFDFKIELEMFKELISKIMKD